MTQAAAYLTAALHWRYTPTVALAAALALLAFAVRRTARPAAPVSRRRHGRRAVPGARAAYVVAVACTGVSLDTSWYYFGDRGLHIQPVIVHVALFAVLELALIACGLMMRAGIQLTGHPGPARTVAWACCGASAYMAWQVSGPLGGTARVALGPLLGLWMLHLALGIEVRAARRQRTGMWARVAAELRERLISRLGLADEARPAAERTRDRAARRAARLAQPHGWPWSRTARLGRALAASGAALDPAVRDRLVAELAVGKHAGELRTLDVASPWPNTNTPPNTAANSSANTNTAPRTGGSEHAANTSEQALTSGEHDTAGHGEQSGGEAVTRPRLTALPGGAANTQAELIRALAEHGVADPDEVVRRVREQFPDAKPDSVRTQLRRITRGAQPRRAANQ